MALNVLGTIPLAVVVGLWLAEDGGAPLLRPCVVGVDVIDVDQDAVHDVRHAGPLLRRLAFRPVAPRRMVVRGGRCQHDDALTRLHFAVAEPAVLSNHPGAFSEAKR